MISFSRLEFPKIGHTLIEDNRLIGGNVHG